MHDSTDSANNVVSMSEDFRTLDVPYSEQVLGCVGDAWVRTVHFSAPRYCDGTDLSGYDFTVQFVNEAGVSDLYEVEDLATDTNTLTFSWLVSPIACAVLGSTQVSVIASNVDSVTGDVLNRFVTTTYNWKVLPSTTAEGGEAIEAATYVETMIAGWQADIDTMIASANNRNYETVADMQADTTLSAGMICHTLGFYAAGDGGAAWYLISSTGTANGMDVLALSSGVAVLQITEPYVTPEMFGAYGDGVHDDTDAVDKAISNGNVKLSAKTYCVYDCVIKASGRKIIGTGSTINHGARHGLVVRAGIHDIEINCISFIGTYTPNTDEFSNGGVVVASSSLTEFYESYNIHINACSFDGGVFGIVANSTKNIEIDSCNFGSFVFKPIDNAGGYGILTQSCINVNIHDCYFKRGNYGRHDIYVSIAQNKTDNIKSLNYVISNCVFDMSDMTTQESGSFYSPSTPCVNVRHVDNFRIDNCIGYATTGIINFTAVDGAIKNAVVDNIASINPIYFSAIDAPYETRATVNLAFNTDDGSICISNVKTIEPNSENYLDVLVSGGIVHIENITITNRIAIDNVKALFVNSCVYDTGDLYYSGTNVLYGKISNITPKTSNQITVITAVNDNVLHPSLFSAEHFGAFVIGNNGSIAGNTSKVLVPYSYNLSMSKILNFEFPKLSEPLRFGAATSGVANIPKIYACEYVNTTPAVKVYVYDATGVQLESGSLASRIMFLP